MPKKATGYKGTSGKPKAPPAPPITDGGRDFRFLNPQLPVAPAAPVMAPGSAAAGGMSGDEWLSMALSALGGGPDRSAYVQPFDAAAQRARAAHAEAVPAIAANYDRMRQELGGAQQVANRDAAQAQANMTATNQQLTGQIQQNAAPILADLAAQGNTPALGGLLGAAQAQVGAGQAQLAQQAATQQQLSGNLQAAGTAAYNSRLQDSSLAQSAATSNAGNTLNAVISQLDARKAQALQQYAQDSQQHGAAVASARMSAMERNEAKNDPAKQIALERERLGLEADRFDFDARKKAAEGTAPNQQAKVEWEQWHDNLSQKNPVSYDLLYGIMAENDSYAEAIAALNRKIANKETKTKGGKQLDATFLRDRLREAYDIHDRMTADQAPTKAKR